MVMVEWVAGQWGQLRIMTAMSRLTSDNMRTAESAVRSALDAGTPADQMEALMFAYRQSEDRASYVVVLIGNLVSSRALADAMSV